MANIHEYLKEYGEDIYNALNGNLNEMRNAYGRTAVNLWYNTNHRFNESSSTSLVVCGNQLVKEEMLYV